MNQNLVVIVNIMSLHIQYLYELKLSKFRIHLYRFKTRMNQNLVQVRIPLLIDLEYIDLELFFCQSM